MERLRTEQIPSEELYDVVGKQAQKLQDALDAQGIIPARASDIEQWRMLLMLRRAEYSYGDRITVPITVDDKNNGDIMYKQLKANLNARGIRDNKEEHNVTQIITYLTNKRDRHGLSEAQKNDIIWGINFLQKKKDEYRPRRRGG